MLELENIVKVYPSGGENVRALKGVSLQFRNSEFVSVLGPSGCGKTTMLNIIGGLDHYTEGDLRINGRSTKKYKDRDWDTYRNHTIGFVFQSYNLIPHQTVLSNVELALTLSGVGKRERRERAKRALEAVGLGNQLRKRPAQMSGGQMQRVAIARAIVNDPDIILADEPTGALDSETSLQVMNILKEISQDRLVIMVTHNPELAQQYSTRIIRMLDGAIVGDSLPISPEELEALREEDRNAATYGSRKAALAAGADGLAEETPVAAPNGGKHLRKREHKNKKASMSFMTAFGLSLNNLFTKKGRTLLTSFAGSIGIIGIALIYAVSQGTSDYIDTVQEDTLAAYPLSITEESADFTAVISGYLSTSEAAEEQLQENSVAEQQFVASLFSGIGTNDLRSFKAYLDANLEELSDDVGAVNYGYNITPQIYTRDCKGELIQANPGAFSSYISMAGYSLSAFYEMPGDLKMVEDQYDILSGRWPEEATELVLVLSDPNQISDFFAYSVGLHDMQDLEDMMTQIMQGETPELPETTLQWTYEELLNLDLRLLHSSDFYEYDASHNIWEDMRDSEGLLEELYEDALQLQVVGIVTPRKGKTTTTLYTGLNYLPELTRLVMDYAADSEIVAAQQENPEIDVFSGKPFGEQDSESGLNLEDMISVDEEAISQAFNIDFDMDSLGTSGSISGILQSVLQSLAGDAQTAGDRFRSTFQTLAEGFITYCAGQNGGKVTLCTADTLAEEYLNTEAGSAAVASLAKRYSAEEEPLKKVYRPLLAAMLDACILEQHPEITEPIEETVEVVKETAETVKETAEEIQEAVEELQESGAVSTVQSPSLAAEVQSTGTPEETEILPETVSGAALTAETAPEEETSGTPAEEQETQSETDALPSAEELSEEVAEALEVAGYVTAEQAADLAAAYADEPVVLTASKAMGVHLIYPTLGSRVTGTLTSYMTTYMTQMFSGLEDAFRIDEDALANAFQFDMTEEDLTRLITTLSGSESADDAESNLLSLGYANPEEPSYIYIYLKDFEGKDRIKEFIEEYNTAAEEAGEEERVIQYTDITGVLMSSVTTIINAVTYVLIAFVAISLIVSSIMIGVITLISVQERTKEIGILRAIGASKRNVSGMFNAETLIIGFTSGLIGVLTTYLLCIPINMILHKLTKISYLSAKLPVEVAVILVIISMLLTLVAGIIPSRSAAKKDPVVALRTE